LTLIFVMRKQNLDSWSSADRLSNQKLRALQQAASIFLVWTHSLW
jgi:hypothetical protein